MCPRKAPYVREPARLWGLCWSQGVGHICGPPLQAPSSREPLALLVPLACFTRCGGKCTCALHNWTPQPTTLLECAGRFLCVCVCKVFPLCASLACGAWIVARWLGLATKQGMRGVAATPEESSQTKGHNRQHQLVRALISFVGRAPVEEARSEMPPAALCAVFLDANPHHIPMLQVLGTQIDLRQRSCEVGAPRHRPGWAGGSRV